MESKICDIKNNLIKKELEKWLENSDGIKFIGSNELNDNSKDNSNDNNELKFVSEDVNFSIYYPANYSKRIKGLFVMCESQEDNWLSEINKYILDNNPSLGRLLHRIGKLYKNKIMSKCDEISLSVDNDIKEVKLRRYLEKNLCNMKSCISNDNDSKVANLFSKNNSGMILINEYMEIMKKYNNSNNIKIELYDNNIYQWKIMFRDFTNDKLQKSLNTLKNNFGYDYIEVQFNFHDKLYPSYPPFIKVIRPRMKKSVMHKITNLKLIFFKKFF